MAGYLWVLPGSIVGLALLVLVIRANKDDLPAIARALMRTGRGDDDDRKGPPALPPPRVR